MNTWVWPLAYLALRFVVLAAVWFVARRFRRTHPAATRCLTVAVYLFFVATIWNMLIGGVLRMYASTQLFAPAAEFIDAMLNEPGLALYLACLLTGTTIAALAQLLVACAALAQP